MGEVFCADHGRAVKGGEKMDKTIENCWEFMKYGREPGGSRADEFGVCPAATDASFNEINAGRNGGRICWAVAGTFCDNQVQGTFKHFRSGRRAAQNP
jgi:hypothetical protein